MGSGAFLAALSWCTLAPRRDPSQRSGSSRTSHAPIAAPVAALDAARPVSLKAGWDPADDPHLTKCEVLAAWQGYRLRRAGRRWRLVLADEPARGPVTPGLTLDEIEVFLKGERGGRGLRRGRGIRARLEPSRRRVWAGVG